MENTNKQTKKQVIGERKFFGKIINKQQRVLLVFFS